MPDSRRTRLLRPLAAFLLCIILSGAGLMPLAAMAPLPVPRGTPRPLPGSLGPVAVSGTINGAAQSVTCPVGDQGTVTCQITGTWSATLVFEGTVDNLTWATVRANAIASDTLVTGPAANGLYVLSGNFTAIRVRDTAYTSGSAVITMRATPSSSANLPVSAVGGGGGGGGGGGTVTGNLTNNTAAPTTTNIGSLDALANAATPTWVEGNQVLLSTDLSGRLRTTNTPTGTQAVSGTVTANQGGAPWSVSASGTFGVTQSTSPWVVGGGLTNNNAAPGIANFGALVALANAAVPTWVEGNQVLLSADLSGRLRTTNTPTGTQTVSGTVTANAGTGTFTAAGNLTHNNAAPGIANFGALVALANAAVPTWTEGDQVLLSANLAGAMRVADEGPTAAGSAVSRPPVVIGGRDASGNAQYIGGNNSGVFAQGPVANQTAVAGGPVWIAGSTTAAGGNTQGLVVESAAQPNLRVSLFNGSSEVPISQPTDGQSGGNVALVTGSRNQLYNGATWDLYRNNINASIRASTGLVVSTVNTDVTTYNAASFMYHAAVSNYNGGTLTVSLQWKDANGLFVTIPGATTGALSSGADIILAVGPSAWPANTATAFYVNYHVPRLIRVVETVATATVTLASAYELTAN